MPITQDANGWSVFTASGTPQYGYNGAAPSAATTMVVYVSNSTGKNPGDAGFVAATAGSSSTPYRTIAQAASVMRGGSPDWMLLKNGDTWTNESFGFFTVWGKSSTEPIVLSSYDPANPTVANPGTGGARPLLKTVNNASDPNHFNTGWTMAGAGDGTTFGGDYVAIAGIEFYSYQRDPGNVGYVGSASLQDSPGVSHPNNSNFFFIEDCKISFYQEGIDFTGTHQNVTIRRCVVTDCYSNLSNTAGLHTDKLQLLLVEDSYFDQNGWNPTVTPRSTQTGLNRNVYLSQFDKPNCVTWRNNISSNSADHGAQFRTGGSVTDSLFFQNTTGFNFGHPLSDSGSIISSGVAQNNVILEGIDLNATNPRGYGVVMYSCTTSGIQVTNNIFAHVVSATPGAPITLDTNCNGAVANNNIIYSWGSVANNDQSALDVITPNPRDQAGYTHPSATAPGSTSLIGDYYNSIGGTVNEADFVTAFRAQSKATWNTALTAHAVNEYIRTGFNISTHHSGHGKGLKYGF